ncbi:MAG: adenosylmethionine--8-amino-7-oxononanoate transaminase [Rhodothalassiaceae bacterium]
MAASDDRGPGWYRGGLEHVWLPYTQMKTARPPLPVVRTEGCRIHLADGRVLVDGIASWWTAAHGYNHPHLLKAVADQLERLPHVMFGGLVHEPALRLAQRLAAITPGDLDRVFFAESGSVAVEVALKMAVQYWLNRGERRSRFVFFRHGYHGDTTGAMAVCDPEEGMHARFSHLLARHLLAELPHSEREREALDALLARHREDIAAIIIEPLVQGAGGMRFHEPEVLGTVARLARAHETLLIADEIFTGFGRTGTLFACEQAGVVPDIMTLSKALTGGVAPLSACLARAHVFDAFLDDDPEKALMHGPTYMAHALGCAAANASLDLFACEDRLAQVAAIAAQMRAELAPCRRLRGVRDVRVMGAIGVVELERIPDPEALRAAFVARGVWIRPLGRVVYLTPSLTIARDELTILTSAIRDVLGG